MDEISKLRHDLAATESAYKLASSSVHRLEEENTRAYGSVETLQAELDRSRDEVQHLIKRNREQAEEIDRLKAGKP